MQKCIFLTFELDSFPSLVSHSTSEALLQVLQLCSHFWPLLLPQPSLPLAPKFSLLLLFASQTLYKKKQLAKSGPLVPQGTTSSMPIPSTSRPLPELDLPLLCSVASGSLVRICWVLGTCSPCPPRQVCYNSSALCTVLREVRASPHFLQAAWQGTVPALARGVPGEAKKHCGQLGSWEHPYCINQKGDAGEVSGMGQCWYVPGMGQCWGVPGMGECWGVPGTHSLPYHPAEHAEVTPGTPGAAVGWCQAVHVVADTAGPPAEMLQRSVSGASADSLLKQAPQQRAETNDHRRWGRGIHGPVRQQLAAASSQPSPALDTVTPAVLFNTFYGK